MLSAMFGLILGFCMPVANHRADIRERVFVSILPLTQNEYKDETPDILLPTDFRPSFFADNVRGDTIIDIAIDGAQQLIMTSNIRDFGNHYRISVFTHQNMINPASFYMRRIGRRFVIDGFENNIVICR